MAEKPNGAKARAEASFQKKEQLAREGDKARAEYEAAARARDANTARLKALRLAKEAADGTLQLKNAPKKRPVRRSRWKS
jgi:hypothetical protein